MTLLLPNQFPAKAVEISENKQRGGYYTSIQVAKWLSAWAIRTPNDRVLEPSCGDGVFLRAAAEQLQLLGCGSEYVCRQIRGVEITPAEVVKARSQLANFVSGGAGSAITCGDFFEWHEKNPFVLFSSVIGNPPFIRYQSFPEPSRSRAMRLMESQGLRPNMLTNIWVPFVVGAVSHLLDGGRMALVIPAELLQVSYAAQLREYLLARFKSIDVIACNHLFFENAQQEVVLLLADGFTAEPSAVHKCHIDFIEIQSVDQLSLLSVVPDGPRRRAKTVRHDREKWLKYFLTPYEISLMRRIRESDSVVNLSDHAQVDVGVVTGNNAFFVVSKSTIKEFKLEQYVSPLIGRSAHLRGAFVNDTDWAALADRGEKVFLLNVPKDAPLESGIRRYIAYGEASNVHEGYKCSIRKPWYFVPGYWIPEAFLFRQIHDFPRPVLNRTKATSTDTIHRLRCKGNTSAVVAGLYTHLTGASAEIVGRSYGGGVLELEPTEAEDLMIPRDLSKALPIAEIDRLIRLGRIEEVLELNDQFLLKSAGLSDRDTSALKRIWLKMQSRRHSRRRTLK